MATADDVDSGTTVKQHSASSAPAPESAFVPRQLTRGKWTYYGDGLTEYNYTPPAGRTQRVCGVLGKNKQETIDLVKKGFPDLAGVNSDRFDFEIYNHRGLWVRVMDEAWELLNRDPPLVWVIKIRELPGERQERVQRQRHDGTCALLVLSVIIFVILVLFFILMT